MNYRLLRILHALIAFALTTVPLANAESVAITYSLTGTGTVVGGTDTTLALRETRNIETPKGTAWENRRIGDAAKNAM